jgi:hypothetical protein
VQRFIFILNDPEKTIAFAQQITLAGCIKFLVDGLESKKVKIDLNELNNKYALIVKTLADFADRAGTP